MKARTPMSNKRDSSRANIPLYLTFDDVLLKPQYSEIIPTETDVRGRFSRRIELAAPLASSAMDTVTESTMAIAVAANGGIGVIHKNMTVSRQAAEVEKVKRKNLPAAAAVGATGDYFERAAELVKAGADAIVVDTAHGHSKRVIEAVKKIKSAFGKKVDVVAGNVATAEGFAALVKAGADGIKIGIGPGSICTTRVVSGTGVPQLSAILECAPAAKKFKVPLIADGGIKYSGDAVKALAAGASCIMVGSMLSGTDEAPGEILVQNGQKVKAYRGMGSLGAMELGSKDRYGQESLTVSKLVPEGVEAVVKYKGPAEKIIFQLIGGIKSGLGYCGAKNILELQKKAEFVQITSAGFKESHPHTVTIAKSSPNYH